MEIIDLRSDTVSQPTPEMREAMANASVGDDVYGEDPTINRLQELAAAKVGKEAGLFVASGTMGNLVAVLTHCGRGDEAMMGDQGHTFVYEAGGISALGGVHPHPVQNLADGTIELSAIQDAIRGDDVHFPISRLLILENTQNRCGGVPISAEYTRAAGELVHEHGLYLHLDGARIFNAAAACSVSAAELARPADSITFCLSKGLCAPVGSVLCGSADFVRRARRIRKQLGGGMRQAGILAAAGIVALEKMTDRLCEDHVRAHQLAQGLAQIPGIRIDAGSPYTNMIFLTLEGEQSGEQVARRLASEFQVKVGEAGRNRFRLVTHYWIDDQAVERTIAAFSTVLQ